MLICNSIHMLFKCVKSNYNYKVLRQKLYKYILFLDLIATVQKIVPIKQ